MSSNPIPDRRRQRIAIAMLLVATLLWGMGFTWAKSVGAAVNTAAGRPEGSVVGPTTMLAGRCLAGAVLWAIAIPASRRGWTRGSVLRSLLLGGILGLGLVLQHLGLDQTTEAVSAFLTNLTIVIVPILIALVHRRLPAPPLIGACALALAGIWALTGAKATGLSTGELFGVACAFAFSVEILAVNHLAPRETAERLTLGMFIVAGIICLSVAVASPGFGQIAWGSLMTPSVLTRWSLLTVFVTCVSFGLMNVFQPRIEPTRATLVYLFEPIFAAVFAWISRDVGMTRTAIYGAGLILLANIVAELRWPGSPAAYDVVPEAEPPGTTSEP